MIHKPNYSRIIKKVYLLYLLLNLMLFLCLSQVNDDEVDLTYYIKDDNGNVLVKIYNYKNRVRINTNFGLVIQYDGEFVQRVYVPGEAADNVQGLCGNFNGNKLDEKILPDSTDLTNDPQSDSKLAEYYQVSETNSP